MSARTVPPALLSILAILVVLLPASPGAVAQPPTSRHSVVAGLQPGSAELAPVRRTFTYSVAFRGRISADRRRFATLVAESFADQRGWRAAGFGFRRVERGGDFTVWLAEASTVPGFGAGCSATWSCRVGRDVVINQTRWQHATAPWRAAGRSLRGYRHLVLNHETGHWLGHGHARCGGPGQPAPVMMQQSIRLDGCRFNPFPLRRERWTSR